MDGRNAGLNLNKSFAVEKSLYSPYNYSETMGPSLHVTSSDILKTNGMVQKQREEVKNLNNMLPTFQSKPSSLLTSNNNLNRLLKYTYTSQGTL